MNLCIIGCSHGCICCDSNVTTWNMILRISKSKQNAIEFIRKGALKRRHYKVYIEHHFYDRPLYSSWESEVEMSERHYHWRIQYDFGFTLITKSSQFWKTDLLKNINAKTKCVVQMTSTTYNESLIKYLGANVSTTYEEHLEVLRLHNAGIQLLCKHIPHSSVYQWWYERKKI